MPPVPRPHWKDAERQAPQPLWRRLLLGFFNVLTIFGGARAVGATQLPQFIRPLYYRVRLKDAMAATVSQPTQTVENEVVAAPEVIASRIHTVVKGDSLWKIAKDSYGNGQRWIDIWRLNRAKITEADLIYPGQEFLLPDVELHRASGARPGVSVKDVMPSMRMAETKTAPSAPKESKAEAGAGAKKTSVAAEDAKELKDQIQPRVDALAKSLGELRISVERYTQTEKAKKVSADDLKHITSYAAEAQKLKTAVSSASSKTQTIDVVANLLDVSRDATTTVSQITAAETPRGVPSPYPGGVYQTSTGAPSAPAPSTPAGASTVAPIVTTSLVSTLETLPAGYAWRLYPGDPAAQPDVAYPTGSGPFSIPAGYQVTRQFQTTPTQEIAGPAGDSWIFNTETGALYPNRVTSATSAAVVAPVAAATATVAMQTSALSQTAGEQVGTAGALSPAETEVLINSSAQTIRGAITPSLKATPQGEASAASALSYTKNALSKTEQATASGDAAGAVLAATMAVSGAISANVAAPNTAAAMQATNIATEAAETLQRFDQAALAEAAAQLGGDGGSAVGGVSGSVAGTSGTAASGSGGITASSLGIGMSGLGGGQGDVANAAIQAAIGSITLGLAGESNLSLTQNITALAIGIIGVVAGVPGLGVVAAGIMGSVNQSQSNASLIAQQQNIVTQIAYQGYRAGEINNPGLVGPVLSMISIDLEPIDVIAIQAVEAAQAAEAAQSSNVNTLGDLANIGVTSSGLQGIDAAAASALGSGIGIGGAGSIGYSGTIASVANALGITQSSLIGQLAQAGKISPEQAAKLMSQVDEDAANQTVDPVASMVDTEEGLQDTSDDVGQAAVTGIAASEVSGLGTGLGEGEGNSPTPADVAAAVAVDVANAEAGAVTGEPDAGVTVSDVSVDTAGSSSDGPSSDGPSSSGPSSGGGDGGQAP